MCEQLNEDSGYIEYIMKKGLSHNEMVPFFLRFLKFLIVVLFISHL